MRRVVGLVTGGELKFVSIMCQRRKFESISNSLGAPLNTAAAVV